MKTTFLKAGLLTALVIILVMGVLLFKRSGPISNDQPSGSNIIDEARIEAKAIAREVDKKGYSKVVYERKNAILSNGDITKLPVSQSVFDSLRLDNLDKTKKLQQASIVTATITARALRATKMLDSLQRKQFKYGDEYLSASFTPDSLGGTFDVDYRLNLIRQDYRKRKNFLSPYVDYTEILSPDRRVTIAGLQSLTIDSRKPTRFGIGIQSGYYYDPLQHKFLPAIGLGLSYNLIRF